MTPQQIDELSGSKGKLIGATVELMAARGFESTSVQDILDTAQVTKSNFYYHFKSKEDLCLAALDVMEEKFFEWVINPTILNKALSPKNRLQAMFGFMLEKMEGSGCQQGCPFTNLATETSDFHPEFQHRLARFYQRQAKAFEQCLEDGIQTGEFRKDLAPAQVSTLILSAINGTMTLAKAYKSADVIQQNMAQVFQLLAP